MRFFWVHRRLQFLEGPGEVVAIVVETDVRVLARVIAAAGAVGKDFFGPGQDSFRRVSIDRVLRELPRMNVVREESRVVVEHLLEVRDDPPRVRRVPMEPASDLILVY